MKQTVFFLFFVLIVTGILYSLSGNNYPVLPDNAVHKVVVDAAVCLSCHGPEGSYPRKESHPPKNECFQCHKVKRSK